LTRENYSLLLFCFYAGTTQQERPNETALEFISKESSICNTTAYYETEKQQHKRRMPRGRRERRRYDAVASQEEAAAADDSDCDDEKTASDETTTPPTPNETPSSTVEEEEEEEELDEKECIHLTILDFAQTRFKVAALPSWTVGQFKEAGTKVHKVTPLRQRLIFRGKLLGEDDKTLESYGITEDGTILHLFPKPRVIITNSSTGGADAAASEEDPEGARVPTIIMDAAEAERRSDILVLGSMEFIEAQNNVKLFSFMLLIISSIELLNLFSIAMGVPQNSSDTSGLAVSNEDDIYSLQPSASDDDYHNAAALTNHTYYPENSDPAAELYAHWGLAQYVDTLVSALGVYVAILGLKASTENTLKLARLYMVGLFCAGAAWLLFNFFFTAAIERKIEERQEEMHEDNEDFEPDTDADIYQKSFQVMILPGMVWAMCWIRAWNFQHLLYEAESEAEERIQSQLDLEDEQANHDEELALGNQGAVFT
jgi:hypothetical protein